MNNPSCDLSSCFLCKHCIPEWKEAIGQKRKTLFFKKGKAIFLEGEPMKGLFFLYKGAVKIHKQWTDEKELIIRFATAGDIVGYRGLGVAQVYPVSATALVDTEVCFILNDFLDATFKINPGFTYSLMQYYSDELQKKEMRMYNLAAWEAKAKIAAVLLDLDTLFGRDPKKFIAVPVSRQDIASYAGTTYETVFKVLRIFAKEGIISTSAKSIKLNNAKKLYAMLENKIK
jgi:CRP-like cAMP-binding protein